MPKNPIITKISACYSYNLLPNSRISNSGYYRNLTFHIEATNNQDQKLIMVDGGNPNWTQTMLASKKETIVVSGMGSELFIRKFGIDINKLQSLMSKT